MNRSEALEAFGLMYAHRTIRDAICHKLAEMERRGVRTDSHAWSIAWEAERDHNATSNAHMMRLLDAGYNAYRPYDEANDVGMPPTLYDRDHNAMATYDDATGDVVEL